MGAAAGPRVVWGLRKRTGLPTISRMTRPELAVCDYDPSWPESFAALGQRLRVELGSVARRIDHIGSTAVPGLAAKPIIDVQISVASLDPVSAYEPALRLCGFVWRSDNPDLTKRYFREQPGAPRTHIHVRSAGSFSEQFALLFRDYLRNHPAVGAEYSREKRQLEHMLTDRHAYTTAKGPVVWRIMRDASEWSQEVGWQPGASDA